MSIDTWILIVSGVVTLGCHIGYQHCCKNVYLTYKDQRVGGRSK